MFLSTQLLLSRWYWFVLIMLRVSKIKGYPQNFPKVRNWKWRPATWIIIL